MPTDESHFLTVGESQLRSLLGDHLLQRLQQDTEGKLHQRLFRCLRGAIIDGVIQPKTRLPASRDLASEIHVSRNTVLTAYEQLQAEGYLEARTGHGTWVAEKLPESFLNTQNKKKWFQARKFKALMRYRSVVPTYWAMPQPRRINGELSCRERPM